LNPLWASTSNLSVLKDTLLIFGTLGVRAAYGMFYLKRSYWKNYFEQTDGLIFVIDSNSTDRLELCKQELHSLVSQERLVSCSVLIYANKQDLACLSTKEIEEYLDLKHVKQHFNVVGCSAVTGQNIEKGLEWIVDDISKRIFTFE
jgi:ADP-ribosylation factor-like protein 2